MYKILHLHVHIIQEIQIHEFDNNERIAVNQDFFICKTHTRAGPAGSTYYAIINVRPFWKAIIANFLSSRV